MALKINFIIDILGLEYNCMQNAIKIEFKLRGDWGVGGGGGRKGREGDCDLKIDQICLVIKGLIIKW